MDNNENELEKTEAENELEQIKDSPIMEIAEAVIKTVANPSAENLLADMKLAIRLVEKMKSQLENAHPSVWELIKSLL